MHTPPHLAEIIKEDILPALGLSVTEAAKQLGINRVTLSRILNGKSAISAEMAIHLYAWQSAVRIFIVSYGDLTSQNNFIH